MGHASSKRWKLTHPEENRAYNRAYQKRRQATFRAQALDHYGASCACCGEPNRKYLTFDHVNNNGAEHRRNDKLAASHLAEWLVRSEFPEGYQVLCWNCNAAKEFYGGCADEDHR